MTDHLIQGYYMRHGESEPWVPCSEVRLAHIVGDGARLLHDLLYMDPSGAQHHAADGTPTDGGTKPRWSWIMVGHPYDPRYLRAYVIHDAECHAARRIYEADLDRGRELRLHADRTFREGVRCIGASPWRAASYYRAVRLGAFIAMGW